MKIRKAKKDEYKKYIKLRRESMKYLSKISKVKLTLSDKKIKEEFLTPITNKRNLIYFLENEEGIVGYLNILLINRNGKKTSYLNDIIISKKFRGKGYGKTAMKWFIDFSKKRGVDRIGMGTRYENVGAQKFYKSLGFKEIGINYGMLLKWNPN